MYSLFLFLKSILAYFGLVSTLPVDVVDIYSTTDKNTSRIKKDTTHLKDFDYEFDDELDSRKSYCLHFLFVFIQVYQTKYISHRACFRNC